jgi:broad specificity phosphatase PhoE
MFECNRPTPKRLFLARHGESVANQQKLVSGQLDTPLTEKGRRQAQWLCDVLKNEQLSVIYASSLSRAVETARPTSDYHGVEIQQVDNFKERHFGILQGQVADGAETDAKALWQARIAHKLNATIPGSEDFPSFERRIADQLEQVLRNLPSSALIVAHRNTNQVILSKLLGLSLPADTAINVKNKYLYEIELGDHPTVNTIRLGGEFHGKKFAGLKDE